MAPRLLPDRMPASDTQPAGSGRQFIAQISVSSDSKLVGVRAIAGLFPDLPELTIRMIQRGQQMLLPPFADISVHAGDVLAVAATRKVLTELLKSNPRHLHAGAGHADLGNEGEQTIAEAMVTPASRLPPT